MNAPGNPLIRIAPWVTEQKYTLTEAAALIANWIDEWEPDTDGGYVDGYYAAAQSIREHFIETAKTTCTLTGTNSDD